MVFPLVILKSSIEINIRRLWRMRRTIFGFGAAQVMMVAVMLFPLLFGATQWSIMGCVMVSLMLAMSSTTADMQILVERNQMNTDMGRQAFSILLFFAFNPCFFSKKS